MTETTCKIPGCDKPRKANGWCSMHYQRWFRHGDPLVSRYLQPPKTCSVEGCDGITEGHGWCSRHYQRWQRHGDPLGGGRSRAEMFSNLGHTCSVDDCGKSAKALGLCTMHYGRWLRHDTTDKPDRKRVVAPPCSIEGCDAPSETRGWCDKHYQRWRNHGDPMVLMVSEITESCSQAGCERRIAKAALCWKHYRYFKAKFMKEQDGKCYICHVPAELAPRKILVLDHCHATNQPRALLCTHCNWGLGHFLDNPDLLRAAARYVEEMKPGQLPLFAA